MRLLAALLLLAASGAEAAPPPVQDGDLIFQTSRSSQSRAVQLATGSKYSHMGMVAMRHGKPYVYEAVKTVRYTPLQQWIARGSGSHYVVKRLADAPDRLDPAGLRRLAQAELAFEGRPYDLAFEWSDERMYCSELVWKVYQRALGVRIGELQKIRDFRLDDPQVAAKLRERYGDHVPLDEPVISPVAMFESPLLVTVIEN